MLLSLSNDSSDGPSDSYYRRFTEENVLNRLRRIDAQARAHGLSSLDPGSDPLIRIGMEVDPSGRVTKNGYGVFDLAWQWAEHPEWAGRIAAEAEAIRRNIRDSHRSPLRFLIWAGMGGSAEDKSMYNAAGLLRRGPRCYVLDSTDPGKLKAILDDIDRRHALPITAVLRGTLVVGMAMGMTSFEPVLNLEKLANLYERYRVDSRPNFVYMTLPGSLLDRFGAERGYRKIELQPDGGNTTAGRHSGPLTRGSLYPLALAKCDLASWTAGAQLDDEQVHTVWRLASFIHAHGVEGRDKVTLLLPKEWIGAAIWTKQDFEESLGKDERLGVKIEHAAKPRLANYHSPKDPKQDRVFVAVQVKGLAGPDSAKIGAIRRAGYPTAVLNLPRETPLSRYMQAIHYAVFGLGYLRNMNFVTQPGVELYKSVANRIYAEAQPAGGAEKTAAWQQMIRSPKQACYCGSVTLHWDRLCFDPPAGPGGAPETYAAIVRHLAVAKLMEYGELTYFGDTRYCRPGTAIRKRMDRIAESFFRGRLNMPADVYEGPAMNHSYHEMVIGHGKCLSTVILSRKQEQFPAARYSPDYHISQFLATQIALAERNRPVVSITLKDMEDGTLSALEDFFRRAATYLRPGRI